MTISPLGMVFILHALGVLVTLALILFGTVSVTVIQEKQPLCPVCRIRLSMFWPDEVHPTCSVCWEKVIDKPLRQIFEERYAKTKKEKNPNR